MSIILGQRSLARLEGVHPDLVRVVQRLTDEGVQFKVIEGVRSLERQRALFAVRRKEEALAAQFDRLKKSRGTIPSLKKNQPKP